MSIFKLTGGSIPSTLREFLSDWHRFFCIISIEYWGLKNITSHGVKKTPLHEEILNKHCLLTICFQRVEYISFLLMSHKFIQVYVFLSAWDNISNIFQWTQDILPSTVKAFPPAHNCFYCNYLRRCVPNDNDQFKQCMICLYIVNLLLLGGQLFIFWSAGGPLFLSALT